MIGRVTLPLIAFLAGPVLADPGTGASGDARPRWYSTIPIDRNYVDEKSRMELSAKQAARVLGSKGDGLPANWSELLPQAIRPAERISSLPDDRLTRRVEEPQPLHLQIAGFDEDRVRVLLVRHAGNYLWHWYYSVEADLMIERSDAIDRRLGMETFATPFTRTVEGIGYGASPKEVHAALGPPDATRSTQASGLFWDYYFERKITVEYRFHVFRITDGVPSGLRENPLVRFRSDTPRPSPVRKGAKKGGKQ